MNNYVISETKLEERRSRFAYFNHHQELGTYEKIDYDLIPQEFLYFIRNDKSYESLSYRNAHLMFNMFKHKNSKVNAALIDTLTLFSDTEDIALKNAINADVGLWDRLLDRSKATYSIDFNRDKGKIVTQSILHIYSSAYENTEVLKVLYWIVQAITGQALAKDFKKFNNKYGEFSKGLIITDIFKQLGRDTKLAKFKNVVESAYYKNLRHLSSHNDALLDDNKKIVVNINDSSKKIPYTKVFKSLYAIQQLHNFIRMYVNFLMLEDDNSQLVNEGFIGAFTEVSEEDNSLVLSLLQLDTFFDYDQNSCQRIDCLEVTNEKNVLSVSSDSKSIIQIEKDLTLIDWFRATENHSIQIRRVEFDIFENMEDEYILNFGQYGRYITNDFYLVRDTQISN